MKSCNSYFKESSSPLSILWKMLVSKYKKWTGKWHFEIFVQISWMPGLTGDRAVLIYFHLVCCAIVEDKSGEKLALHILKGMGSIFPFWDSVSCSSGWAWTCSVTPNPYTICLLCFGITVLQMCEAEMNVLAVLCRWLCIFFVSQHKNWPIVSHLKSQTYCWVILAVSPATSLAWNFPSAWLCIIWRAPVVFPVRQPARERVAALT